MTAQKPASKSDGNSLSSSELTRYSRHLLLEEVGKDGQLRMKQSRALVIGMGGLGSPISLYLAAAGVGTLGVVDFDLIELSNLQRQILHSTGNVGKKKTQSAKDRLHEVNPEIEVIVHEERISVENALQLISRYDVVIDGTDNFQTRYLVNDACFLGKKPLVYGSIFRFEGQATVFYPPHGPCYRCIYPEPPEAGAVPNCAEGGVLGVLAGVIGSIQAAEAIKLLLGKGQTLMGRLLLYDALEASFETLNLKRNSNCPLCGDKPSIKTLEETNFVCRQEKETKSSMNAKETEDNFPTAITPTELSELIKAGKSPYLLDVRSIEETMICNLANSHLIPLPELEYRLKELDKDEDIVVYCHAGVRSHHAASLMRRNGFKKVRNLTGGITAWALDVDRSMPRY
ncbi:MAG TPA: molybdopterin-synthase adenylyltransferase MoeB [Candidatus Melainabacteria bacterium]|nr:molybdopterin-synthase adenylyltransferase MoeB [Candidatus Melainabacteria bacterium]